MLVWKNKASFGTVLIGASSTLVCGDGQGIWETLRCFSEQYQIKEVLAFDPQGILALHLYLFLASKKVCT